MNMLENIVTEMSPQEFEIYCLDLLRDSIKNLSEYHIEHNKIYETDDGSYQLDGITVDGGFKFIKGED